MRLLNVWLLFYNAVAFCGWAIVAVVLWTHRAPQLGAVDASQWVATLPLLRLLNGAALLEIVHVLTGMSRGGIGATIPQVGIRMLQTFVSLPALARLSEDVFPRQHTFAWLLIVAWTAIELIRYPFYISQLLHRELPPLSWLRYSAWLVLYPVGIACELVVLYCALPAIHTQYGSVAFYIAAFLIALGPWLALGQLRYMWRQRVSKLADGTPTQTTTRKDKKTQ